MRYFWLAILILCVAAAGALVMRRSAAPAAAPLELAQGGPNDSALESAPTRRPTAPETTSHAPEITSPQIELGQANTPPTDGAATVKPTEIAAPTTQVATSTPTAPVATPPGEPATPTHSASPAASPATSANPSSTPVAPTSAGPTTASAPTAGVLDSSLAKGGTSAAPASTSPAPPAPAPPKPAAVSTPNAAPTPAPKPAAPDASSDTSSDIASGLASLVGDGSTKQAESTTTAPPPAPAATATGPKLEPQPDGSTLVDGKYTIKGTGSKEDPYRITWEMLVSAQDTYQPRLGRKQLPERIKMINGKWVSVSGYIAFPLMAQSADEMLMMLNQWDGCCIGVPPTPYDAIEVKLKTPAKGDDRLRTTGTLVGVLRVDPYLVKDWLVSLYVMDNGEVTQSAGAATPGQHAK